MNVNDIPYRPDFEAVKERFERLFERGLGCWEVRTPSYGTFRVADKSFVSSRVAYVIYKRRIPNGLCVLHRCDNPRCVNPDHLFIGTVQANNIDKLVKGRQARGEGNHAKLTEDEVRAIRTDMSASSADMARFYGVSRPTISLIRRGKKWAHAPFDPVLAAGIKVDRPRGESHRSSVLKEAEVREIHAAKGTHAAIGARYGVSASAVDNIKLGRRWVHLKLGRA